MKIGKYEVKIIDSGYFSLDGGAMFGIIPKVLWEKNNPADEQNRIRLATRLLLLQSNRRNILIDTGLGNKWIDKTKGFYDIQNEGILESELKAHNLNNYDITDVILTHLHFDHAGGATINNNGKLEPSFPNASYYVQEKNFRWAENPSDRDKGSYLNENFEILFEEGILNFNSEYTQFDDEIELIPVDGHTIHQQLVKISDGTNTILYCADLFPTASHIPLPYIMGYDLQPLVTLEEKRRILKLALDGDWKLFLEHDPFHSFITVKQTNDKILVKEKFHELETSG